MLRFTQPAELNDPFECLPAFSSNDQSEAILKTVNAAKESHLEKYETLTGGLKSQIEKKYSKILKRLEKNKLNLSQEFFKRAEVSMNSNLGIFSVSRRWDSNLMWSHYAQNHLGFCIGFKRTHSFFQSSYGSADGAGKLTPVEYDNKRVKVQVDPFKPKDLSFIFKKSIDWEYENEERVIWDLSKCQKRIPGATIIKSICLFKVPHEAIVEVIIGVKASSQTRNKLIEFAKNKNKEIYQADLSTSDFDMIRFKIR